MNATRLLVPGLESSLLESTPTLAKAQQLLRGCFPPGYDAYAVIDASGTFSETKRITGLLRMVQAGVIVTDYSTVAVEMLKDNASSKAGALYGALDMPFAALIGQLAMAFAKSR